MTAGRRRGEREDDSAAARPVRRRRRVALLVAIGAVVLRALALTWRIRVVNAAPVRALRIARQPIVFTLWHGQMLPLLWVHRGEGVAVLISEHEDGELIARAARALGFRAIRGSTTRGAERALLGMVRTVAAGEVERFERLQHAAVERAGG